MKNKSFNFSNLLLYVPLFVAAFKAIQELYAMYCEIRDKNKEVKTEIPVAENV